VGAANALDTDFGEADLDAVIGVPGIAGLFVPKVDSRDDVLRWDRAIADLEAKRGLASGAIKLVLSIESARGVLNATTCRSPPSGWCRSPSAVPRMAILNTDLGCAWSIDGPEMMHARCHALLGARAAGFDTPLDGVFADVRDAEGFPSAITALSRRLGYRGRKLIHPSQIEPCNRLYRPSEPSSTITRGCSRCSTPPWRRAAPARWWTAR